MWDNHCNIQSHLINFQSPSIENCIRTGLRSYLCWNWLMTTLINAEGARQSENSCKCAQWSSIRVWNKEIKTSWARTAGPTTILLNALEYPFTVPWTCIHPLNFSTVYSITSQKWFGVQLNLIGENVSEAVRNVYKGCQLSRAIKVMLDLWECLMHCQKNSKL